MRKKIKFFAELLLIMLLSVSVVPSSGPSRTAVTPDGPPVQIISLAKHKRQKPAEEDREAQAMPWANRIDGCTVTFYDCCERCCGNSSGITYSGARAIPYETCAVDPGTIPIGSVVVADYGDGVLHHYRAEDTGGAVKGNHIDVCVASHEEALALGRRTATVYWIETEDE